MWWESNYQRTVLAILPDPAICTLGCRNRLCAWDNQKYINVNHIHTFFKKDCIICQIHFKEHILQLVIFVLMNENAVIIPCQKVMPSSFFQCGFQCRRVFQVQRNIQKTLVNWSLFFTFMLFYPLSPVWLWTMLHDKTHMVTRLMLYLASALVWLKAPNVDI